MISSDGLTLLMIDVGPNAAATYDVGVTDGAGHMLISSQNVPVIDGFVQVAAGQLQPGAYALRATPVNDDRPVVQHQLLVEAR